MSKVSKMSCELVSGIYQLVSDIKYIKILAEIKYKNV